MTQTIQWRRPCTERKWKGQAEVVLSTVTNENEPDDYRMDIRVRRIADHPSGAGWTKQGVRMSKEDAYSLAQAIMNSIDEVKE
jgi:hypothetical protein|tara:strand:+ start:13324 stop:13572 length:249 start_codon:yes stop_codon:yes gene_type:complete